ncbi:MAG: alpha/beta hydrolase [Flavobacteriales bacterium]|nr:alpha/beta hydrolase [Flavobacteriales bacterium]
MYIKTFGNQTNPPILFLHGGPGYNAANFESTTAEKLAQKGFFVVLYDRRGEGRSVDTSAKFTFEQTVEDLNSIIETYSLKKVTLIGHSFGGVVGTKYLLKYPTKIKHLILVGAPISFQETFQSIIESSEKIFKQKKDASSLEYLKALQKMDPSSLQYSGYCFMFAMRNGFYSPTQATEQAVAINQLFKQDSILFPTAMKMTQPPVVGFWKNENYTMLDLSSELTQLINNGNMITGLYGSEDGLFSKKQLKRHSKILGTENLKILENCSHNVFIDQQEEFIEYLINHHQ